MSQSKVAKALASLLVSVESLHEDPENSRYHSDHSVDAVATSMAQFGQQKPVVALTDGTVIAGNGMLRAARKLGWNTIAALTWGGTAFEAMEYALVANRSAEVSEWDELLVARAVLELSNAAPVLAQATGFSDLEIREFRRALDLGDAVPLEAPEIKMRLEFQSAEELALYEAWVTGLAGKYPSFEEGGSRVAAYVADLAAEGEK